MSRRVAEGIYPGARIIGNLAPIGSRVWVEVVPYPFSFPAIVSNPISQTIGLTVTVDNKGIARVFGSGVVQSLERTTEYFRRRDVPTQEQLVIKAIMRITVRRIRYVDETPPGNPGDGPRPALRCYIWVDDPTGNFVLSQSRVRYVVYGGVHIFAPNSQPSEFDGQYPPSQHLVSYLGKPPFDTGTTFYRFAIPGDGVQRPVFVAYVEDGGDPPQLPPLIYNPSQPNDPPRSPVWRLAEVITVRDEIAPDPDAPPTPVFGYRERREYYLFDQLGNLNRVGDTGLQKAGYFNVGGGSNSPEPGWVSIDRFNIYYDYFDDGNPLIAAPPTLAASTFTIVGQTEFLDFPQSWRRSWVTGEPAPQLIVDYRDSQDVNVNEQSLTRFDSQGLIEPFFAATALTESEAMTLLGEGITVQIKAYDQDGFPIGEYPATFPALDTAEFSLSNSGNPGGNTDFPDLLIVQVLGYVG